MNNNFIKILIIIAGLVSLSKGILNALDFSHDFQYSPAVMAWQNTNHYDYILNGEKATKLLRIYGVEFDYIKKYISLH